MKKILTSTSNISRCSRVAGIALISALTGCAHAPLRQSTAEIDFLFSADLPAGVTRPVALRTVAPTYPERMICAGIEGSVTVLCWVNLDGVPEDVAAADATLPEFADAAVAALKQWSFVPATRDGRPLALRIAVPFHFRPIFPTTHARPEWSPRR